MANTMPKMTKKDNGKWEAVITIGKDDNGKRIQRHLTAKSRNELEHKIKEYAKETPKSLEDAEMTVGQAVDKYIKRREKDLSPSTILNYKKYRENSFADLMALKINKLTEEQIQKSIDAYAEDHKAKTVINRWNLIYAAVKEQKKTFEVKIMLPKLKRTRLQMPEEDRLMECFKSIEGKGIEIPVLLAATCGLRRGEISALDLEKDVDFSKGLIYINKDMVLNDKKQYIIKPPKTDAANRVIPCPNWVLEKLKQARDTPGYKIFSPNTITTKWHKLADEMGIHCSFHGLRHYYASVMSSLNVPEQYQMERMGHSTNYMLQRYQEYLKTKEAQINNDMMEFYNNLDPNSSQQNAQENI